MKPFKKIVPIIFLSAYLIIGFGLLTPNKLMADTAPPQFTPQIGIPNSNFKQGIGVVVGSEQKNASTGVTVMHSDLLARYINAFYTWGLSIVGVIAVLMLMAAGLIWLTSGGDSGRIGNAKKMIEGVFLGSLLLVGSWFLLNTINPNLTQLPALEMATISKISTGCCEYNNTAGIMDNKNCLQNNGTFKDFTTDPDSNTTVFYIVDGGKCVLPGCCITDMGTTNAVCKNTLKDYCNSGNSTFVQKNCSSLINSSSCKKGDACDGAENGASCDTGAVASSHKINTGGPISYCYQNICWSGNGKEGEPCGTYSGSSCTKNFSQLKDPNNSSGFSPLAPACTQSGYRFDSGGRSCGLGITLDLACCSPN